MKSPLKVVGTVVCLAILLAFPVTRTLGQQAERRPFELNNQAFRFILQMLGLKPLQSWQDLESDAARSSLVILGDTRVLDELGRSRLSRYLQTGGSVMIASDRTSSPIFDQMFRLHISGQQIYVLDKADAYKERVDCPLVRSLVNNHLLMKDVSQIATNRPSFFEPVSTAASPPRSFRFRELALFPASSSVHGRKYFPPLLLMAFRDKTQNLVMLSDHSIFINSMMLQDDNDNFNFAVNCVNWLTDNGKRPNMLFVDDGQIITDFQVPLREIPNVSPGKLARLPAPPVDIVNNVLWNWEEDNIHNRLLFERFSMNQILSAIALSATGSLIFYCLLQIWRARHVADTSA